MDLVVPIPAQTLKLLLRLIPDVHSLGMDKCVMACSHHSGALWSLFTARKYSCWQPSLEIATIKIFILGFMSPLEIHCWLISICEAKQCSV